MEEFRKTVTVSRLRASTGFSGCVGPPTISLFLPSQSCNSVLVVSVTETRDIIVVDRLDNDSNCVVVIPPYEVG